MDKKNKEEEEENEEIVTELDFELIGRSIGDLEEVIDFIFESENKDVSPEILMSLATIAAEVAALIGMSKGDFMDLASHMHDHATAELEETSESESAPDISKLN